MDAIIERVKNEPALVTGLIAAILSLAIAFGVDLSEAQQTAVLGVAFAVMAIVTRAQVTPNRKIK